MLCEGCWRLVRAVKKTENSVEIDENGETMQSFIGECG